MMRMRRYRVFIIISALAILLIFYLGDSVQWRVPLDQVTSFTQKSSAKAEKVLDLYATQKEELETTGDAATDTLVPNIEHINSEDGNPKPAESFPQIELPDSHEASESTEPKSDTAEPPKLDESFSLPASEVDSEVAEPQPTTTKPVHWLPQPEKYPVTSTIKLPTGKQTPIPRIQADFPAEDPARQKGREIRQTAIRQAFKKSWNSYKQFAWGHDEVKPVSRSFKDPFAGWGATLVDSLDTLWIMGLRQEFEEAVEETAKIDFTTTSLKNDLPLFEVTIRYLGGLLAAYDISGAKYPVLLKKAQELGEILYGAFDTPNRMPMTYFRWKPKDRNTYHKSGTHVVLAEIGTLSMEFTRLSQLTKEPKYYDAVARITNAFYEFQNKTSLPGMWPLFVDATGCKKAKTDLTQAMDKVIKENPKAFGGALKKPPPVNKKPEASSGDVPVVPDTLGNFMSDKGSKPDEADELDKRDNEVPTTGAKRADDLTKSDSSSSSKVQKPKEEEKCDDAGLQSSRGGLDTFTLGGMADSVYEYLPKQYLLLGVGNKQYREMHEVAMTPIKDYTMYRPMIPDETRNLRFTGKFSTSSKELRENDNGPINGVLDTNTGHLGCFFGAVVGLGAKIFDRKDEIELAGQLTDGCVWAYEITATGIMAEDIYPVACDSMDVCKWNETKWHEAVDPFAEDTLARDWNYYNEQLALFEEQERNRTSNEALLESVKLPVPETKFEDLDETKYTKRAVDERKLNGEALEEFTGSAEDVAKDTIPAKHSSSTSSALPTSSAVEPEPQPEPTVYVPDKPKPLADYYAERIASQSLPEGIARWGGTNYILRPEAIESVFYMYRITGDTAWQEKGWKMYRAIEKHTNVITGYSAIADVTTTALTHMDSAESFWTGETLKYFYLLFSDPGLVSLDDYVFNTEAHPFLRPDAKVKST